MGGNLNYGSDKKRTDCEDNWFDQVEPLHFVCMVRKLEIRFLYFFLSP